MIIVTGRRTYNPAREIRPVAVIMRRWCGDYLIAVKQADCEDENEAGKPTVLNQDAACHLVEHVRGIITDKIDHRVKDQSAHTFLKST